MRINVTKTFLPPLDEYQEYLKKIWDTDQLTNQGPLLNQFEEEAKQYLTVKYFQFVANGTLALQISLKALDITGGEVITTPYSYVATVSSILWERCTPVFVDINPETLCIDEEKIEKAVTKDTRAIMPVHVYGNACNIEKISKVANKYDIKVIYDAAHAFGVEYNNKSIFDYGDISICSFHSTKPFHTIEGGAVITSKEELNDKLELIKRFGHKDDDHFMLGINAKASEFNAAMGLCNLNYINQIISNRKELSETYDSLLNYTNLLSIKWHSSRNYSYYPVLFKDNVHLQKAIDNLITEEIYPRRYFHPSLNNLPYLDNHISCPISEHISDTVLCLPLYVGLDAPTVEKICRIVNKSAI